mmetsp:Transcript_18045/g.50133  ORF Transcript_18045/g.50133 Transcript_18045/m.50133 type:complete len:143 (+) Transcript_18045:914-1342(+)
MRCLFVGETLGLGDNSVDGDKLEPPEGSKDKDAMGLSYASTEGKELGSSDGMEDEDKVGLSEAPSLGKVVRLFASRLGDTLGDLLGNPLGCSLGITEGFREGNFDGLEDEDALGFIEGVINREEVGGMLGLPLGRNEMDSLG